MKDKDYIKGMVNNNKVQLRHLSYIRGGLQFDIDRLTKAMEDKDATDKDRNNMLVVKDLYTAELQGVNLQLAWIMDLLSRFLPKEELDKLNK